MTSKTCTKCGETKPLTEYHQNKSGKHGRTARCKACVKTYQVEWRERPEVKAHRAERQAAYYAVNRDAILGRRSAYWSEYHAATPHVGWESRYRQRAEQYGFSYLIPSMQSFTREDLVWLHGDNCYHCGGEWTELDHWPIPVSQGGMHGLFNAVPSCADCNQRSWRTATHNSTTSIKENN